MSSSSSTAPAPTGRPRRPGAASPEPRVHRSRDGVAAVAALCGLACAAFVVDGLSGDGSLGLAGVVLLATALALVLRQAVRARVGRPERTSRAAASTGAAASLFVAAFLASVGVLEQTAPQVVDSAVFAGGVAVMSVVLLGVLPVALVVLCWCVARDPRLGRLVRGLPAALVLLLALTAVGTAVAAGAVERWLLAAAVVAAGALLVAFSAGLPRAAGRSTA